jgi:hypothetical protein
VIRPYRQWSGHRRKRPLRAPFVAEQKSQPALLLVVPSGRGSLGRRHARKHASDPAAAGAQHPEEPRPRLSAPQAVSGDRHGRLSSSSWAYAPCRREIQPASAPSTSPSSGASGRSVVTLITMPSARPVTAPTAMATPPFMWASVLSACGHDDRATSASAANEAALVCRLDLASRLLARPLRGSATRSRCVPCASGAGRTHPRPRSGPFLDRGERPDLLLTVAAQRRATGAVGASPRGRHRVDEARASPRRGGFPAPGRSGHPPASALGEGHHHLTKEVTRESQTAHRRHRCYRRDRRRRPSCNYARRRRWRRPWVLARRQTGSSPPRRGVASRSLVGSTPEHGRRLRLGERSCLR